MPYSPNPTRITTDIVLEQGLNFAEIHVTKNETAGTVRIGFGRNQYVMINTEAFDLQLFVDDKPVVGVNSNKLMHLEPYREKTAQQEVDGAGKVADAAGAEGAEDGDRHKGKKVVGYWEDGLAIYEDGTREEKPSAEEEAAKQRRLQEAAAEDDWKEYFGGHTDTRPYGPASVGLDVTFYGSQNLYGQCGMHCSLLLSSRLARPALSTLSRTRAYRPAGARVELPPQDDARRQRGLLGALPPLQPGRVRV